MEDKLRSVPGQANFVGLNKADCGLTAIACDGWKDLIFINLDPAPTQTLREYLEGLAPYGDDFPFAELDTGTTIVVPEVRSNWKIFMDAFQELYHINVLHGQTRKTTCGGSINPGNDPLYFWTYGLH